MENFVFRSKYMWIYESRVDSINLLNESLRVSVGENVFNINQYLINSNISFEIALIRLLNDPYSTNYPYGIIFKNLWVSAPIQLWFDALLQKDFSIEYTESELFDSNALHEILNIIMIELQKGYLSISEKDYMFSGKVVLSIDQVQGVPDFKWGDMKDKALSILIKNGTSPLQNWVKSFKGSKMLVSCFLYNYFFYDSFTIELFDLRWRLTKSRAPEYVEEIKAAISDIINMDLSISEYYDMVVFCSGRKEIKNGKDWLKKLLDYISDKSNVFIEEI